MGDDWEESVYASKSSRFPNMGRSSSCATWLTCIVVTLILLTIWAILGVIAGVIFTFKDAINSEFGNLQHFLQLLVNRTADYQIPNGYTLPNGFTLPPGIGR